METYFYNKNIANCPRREEADGPEAASCTTARTAARATASSPPHRGKNHRHPRCNATSEARTWERLSELAQDEKFLKYNIFAYDLRGHGYTETKTSPNAMDYVRDLASFVNHIKNEYQIKEEDIFIVANKIEINTYLYP